MAGLYLVVLKSEGADALEAVSECGNCFYYCRDLLLLNESNTDINKYSQNKPLFTNKQQCVFCEKYNIHYILVLSFRY